MVGKVTRGKSFRGLATYLVRSPKRVAWTDTRWLGAAEAKEVAREMHTAAQLSSRCEKPVYHVSLSFDSEDAPTRTQMEAACDAVLRDLGLEEHQAFLVAHSDTAHPHVHIGRTGSGRGGTGKPAVALGSASGPEPGIRCSGALSRSRRRSIGRWETGWSRPIPGAVSTGCSWMPGASLSCGRGGYHSLMVAGTPPRRGYVRSSAATGLKRNSGRRWCSIRGRWSGRSWSLLTCDAKRRGLGSSGRADGNGRCEDGS